MLVRHLRTLGPLALFSIFAAAACDGGPIETETGASAGSPSTPGDIGDPGPGVDPPPTAGDGSAGAPGTTLEGELIDDFEDGDDATLLGGGWYAFDDTGDGGGSTITFTGSSSGEVVMGGEGYQSELSLQVEFEFDQGDLEYPPFVGFGAGLAQQSAPLDWSGYSGIAYTYRGAAHGARVETFDVVDYDFHLMAVPASAEWTTVEIPFGSLNPEGWGTEVEFDPTNIHAVSFQVRGETGETGTLQIDDLMLIGNLTDTGPDMTINEPAPPEDATIDSVEITNPLQARAMQYLDKGYNITNWLEQGRFESFTYDESFVEAVAAAGFESLRLPIDLDLYVEELSGTGADTELLIHDDLYLILDSFEEWTQTHGLSLTIDYHQYDSSLDLEDESTLDQAVALWSAVAEHLADNTREDLFYELLNEPELSFANTAPTAAEWTEFAERMIAAIREHDADRPIIFGDVEWYGIGTLSQREPLTDTNIIYAVHFYDPFVFTHQGADWTSMSATHDIPYPYSADRWSEYYSDLGINPSSESWILAQFNSYFRTGNRSALRNRIITIKEWAVDNNVPVICNEFGAYDARSRLEDRERYYTDLISIFEELEIPWQHWFMIMGDDGSVIPEYQTAFGLNG